MTNNQKIITCAFCQGTGKHTHFGSTCPVCKGKGENQIKGKFVTCSDCRGTGQKRGTTLTCYTCGGLGIVPDTREEFKKARKEIKKAREEMDKERPAFTKASAGREEFQKKPRGQNTCFCQSCAKKINRESTIKVCFACFRKIKKERMK